MRRWLFWKLWHVGNALDDGVCWVRSQIDRIEPPFTPAPTPEPAYDNRTIGCPQCLLYIAVPVLQGTPPRDATARLSSALAAHTQAAHSR